MGLRRCKRRVYFVTGLFVAAMHCSHPASGALPARFRRQRILIVGCGDIGARLLRRMQTSRQRLHVMVLCRNATNAESIRQFGVRVLWGDLDRAHSLARFAGLAHRVVHLAPPDDAGEQWWRDLRTLALVRALRRRMAPRQLVYGSTSGVYGNRHGSWVSEVMPAQPHTPRACRRVDAEHIVRHWGRTQAAKAPPSCSVSILRISAIYAPDRAGSTPRERLLRGMSVLTRADDIYINHVHADDLARACWLAMWRGKNQRIYNVNDDSSMKMGDYFEMAAALYNLPKPSRLPLQAAREILPLSLLGFMQESRRMRNTRIKEELRWRPHYPTPAEGLLGDIQGRLF